MTTAEETAAWRDVGVGRGHARRGAAAARRRGGGVRRARLPRHHDPGHRGPGRYESRRALHPLQDQGRAAPPHQPDRPREGTGDPPGRGPPRGHRGRAARGRRELLRPLARRLAVPPPGSSSTNWTRWAPTPAPRSSRCAGSATPRCAGSSRTAWPPASSTCWTSGGPPSPSCRSVSTWPAGSTSTAPGRPTRSAHWTPTSYCGWWARRRSRSEVVAGDRLRHAHRLVAALAFHAEGDGDLDAARHVVDAGDPRGRPQP